MVFEASRAKAIDKLNDFTEQNLTDYSKLRNFDFGTSNRSNVSCLSPYITHGVISELEVIDKSLKRFSFSKSEKFIQEVLWRVYWKGWLELRPNVWSDYLIDLDKIKSEFKNNQNYLNAIEGKTNVDCFNQWVIELKENNYLHNHTRMWFASIWIFTLELPWQLGAEFFMQHLYDGDPASNTLGWRWVAGVQTQGKHYLASEWNINKFTNNRFKNIKLNENAPPVFSDKNYSISKKNFLNFEILEDKTLLIFENNLTFEFSDFKEHNFKKILLVSNETNRTIKLSEKVLRFKANLLKDQKIRLEEKSINCETININDLKNITEEVYALYPTVGENVDFIQNNKLQNIKFLYRKLDQFSWQYCNKGFFNFKNYIPKIIACFN
ncbi:deoxyribodipyrimidine photo-lyase family protein (cryptochrome) [Candidatus Pelagibacter ubique]|uniref:Deoxyribodipyrimidine photo-lyase family protein (Cryptochrome) n=1 Tax=Pelagibacter ubique TaxID=198252 RepID=A0ABX1T1J8_PELUQ|nr:FAD-binding domain-containing protein [Candidatus Pelagibacter ubique]NMN67339.1 deoxyribodipyrimidine photo-lyase family protein (cryptochrome) [Candidatus Pelagibacter ubique]